jgi:hypothetical protein
MNTRIKNRFAILTLASGLFTTGTVWASPDFPDVVQGTLNMACTPQCIICHTDNLGGATTAKRPFGVTLQTSSAVSPTVVHSDVERLSDALLDLRSQEAAGEGQDSDGDGVKDIAELTDPEQPRDPSVPGAGDMCELDVKYGCGARVEPHAPLNWTGALAAGLCALGLGFVARRRWAAR